ncbi:hypothetical protein NLJ89_g5938 [Agrocybe chaxingu]|uniref:L-arabinokinase n=1 Tax=Agrocybe chaxingu TaxID=84603 RepID=A0A9W8MT65_9AGAR|nr:hypothetical protein NLJ89_g5938 [Agrocybe chaxingu]
MSPKPQESLCLAYYCSGHGYGHATRVSAFTRLLLSHNSASVEHTPTVTVYIVSSAPQHVFADSIACGARYRYAEIDPVIVQPLAYRVDRRKSVEVLKKFLDKKDELLHRESEWLKQVGAHGVLSDAAFLGCLAAHAAGRPSVLITNFSFDSVYSYLSTPLLDASNPGALQHTHAHPDSLSHDTPSLLDLVPDMPIPHSELAPLVAQIHEGYRCADLLVRLPGHIPIPSFFVHPPLPASEWVDVDTRRVRPEILDTLLRHPKERDLHPSIPMPLSVPLAQSRPEHAPRHRPRTVIQAPLLVRPPSSGPGMSVYTPEGRSRLLSSIGVPAHLHDRAKTKILIVSFGGQVFKRPNSNTGSRSHSRNASREDVTGLVHDHHKHPMKVNGFTSISQPGSSTTLEFGLANATRSFQDHVPTSTQLDLHMPSRLSNLNSAPDGLHAGPPTSRLATPCHLWIPGAPPASKPLASPTIPGVRTPLALQNGFPLQANEIPGLFVDSGDLPTSEDPFDSDSDYPRLLPDSSWIAIVCGVSKEQWAHHHEGEDGHLPEEFYVAPRDVYMPDLTAVGDVLLGKLGYGTVSECVDACTSFVYVSRPLFIEEHGLRLLLEREGVGVELSRQAYEAGDWGGAVGEALMKGAATKERKRREMEIAAGCIKGANGTANGTQSPSRDEEARKLALKVMDWVKDWWADSEVPTR